MISRDVCRKCRKLFGWDTQRDIVGGYDTWTCPPAKNNYMQLRRVSVFKPPPESCPYKFEHGVAEGMKNDQKKNA